MPIKARKMIEIHATEHRNIPYGAMCHEAADYIQKLEEATRENIISARIISVANQNQKYDIDRDARFILKRSCAALGVPAGLPDKFLVWSNEHHAWWGPQERGYFFNIEQAGRYTHDEADEICRGARSHTDETPAPEVMISEKDAMEGKLPA